jgi:hypothetical protein
MKTNESKEGKAKPRYIVVVNNMFYEKFTSRSGCFYGSTILTDKKSDARKFSRLKDAEGRLSTILFSFKSYTHVKDAFKKKYNIDKIFDVHTEEVLD